MHGIPAYYIISKAEGCNGNNEYYNAEPRILHGYLLGASARIQKCDKPAFADNEAATRIVDFNIPALQHFREVLPLWKDADPFELKEEWE